MKLFILNLLVFIAMMFLSSCSKDEASPSDESNSSEKLTGSYRYRIQAGHSFSQYGFFGNFEYRHVDYDVNTGKETTVNGTYFLKDGILELTDENGGTFTLENVDDTIVDTEKMVHIKI